MATVTANRREVEADPGEPLKPSFVSPCPECPKGTIGRASATGRSSAAFDFGGGRASTLRTIARGGAPLAIAALTSGRLGR